MKQKKQSKKSAKTEETHPISVNQLDDVNEQLTPQKKLLFKLSALLLPFFIILIIEIVLRANGYGGYPSFFREVGLLSTGERLCIVEPAASKPYFFNNPSRPGYAEQTSFVMPKPANTIRIILLGESAAKGYPQPTNLSMSSFLEMMLSDLMPSKRIEVINLGTTAIASFPIVYLAKEALQYDPDLIISYTGNNEFFGAYGTASINSAGIFPTWMLPVVRWFHGLAIVQAVYELTGNTETENRTLMEQMVGQVHIHYDASIREDAAENLSYSLASIVEEAHDANVPIILCTTGSNESGLAPLGKSYQESHYQQDLGTIQRLVKEGRALTDSNPKMAIDKLLKALSLAPNEAEINFYLAKAYTAAGETEKARTYFLAARDFDTMPWRPISVTEEAIRSVSQRHNAILCDIAAAFRDSSVAGATGWELMDDHVHLSVRGQAEAARLMLHAMSNLGGKFGFTTEALGKLPDWKHYAARAGNNLYDEYRVNHTLRILFHIPFMKSSNEEAFMHFNNLVLKAEQGMSTGVLQTVREWQSEKPHAGGLRPITGMVARALIRENRLEEARELFIIAQRQVPDYTSWYLEYKYFALALVEGINGTLSTEDKTDAIEVIEQGKFLLQHGYFGTGLTERYIGRLYQLCGEWNAAIQYLLTARTKLQNEDLVACDQALVMSYVRTGRTQDAIDLLQAGLRNGGKFSDIYRKILQGIIGTEEKQKK